MDTAITTNTKKNSLVLDAVLESWAATVALGAFMIVAASGGNRLVAGGCIVVAAVLAMNGLMKTDMMMTANGPSWWKDTWIFRIFHHVTNEGELAGIFVGLFATIGLALWGEHIHVPVAEACALLGIMSAARIAVRHMVPVMALLERIGGRPLVISGGSLLSSLTGEPAAAIFLVDYVKKRVKSEDLAKMAVGLAAAIGSGGGLVPFAAPPILIVWAILQAKFGWSMLDLAAWVGMGCVMHVTLSSLLVYRLMKKIDLRTEAPKLDAKKAVGPLALLLGMVAAHIFFSHEPWLWAIDIFVGLENYRLARKTYQEDHEHHEEAFAAKWQPTILAGLLIALEMIGAVATPLIEWMGGGVVWIGYLAPDAYAIAVMAVALFFATAWVSHFADNALASRVFIMIPASLIGEIGVHQASLLAAAVIAGALFGGFVTIPANLPNFPIARGLAVGPGPWVRISPRLYWTCVAYLAWIAIRFATL